MNLDAEYLPATTEIVRYAKRLQSENADLRRRISAHEKTMRNQAFAFPRDWRLSGNEARVLTILLTSKRYISSPAIMARLPYVWSKNRASNQSSVYICKIKNKVAIVKPLIKNIRGLGYFIDPDDRPVIMAYVLSEKGTRE